MPCLFLNCDSAASSRRPVSLSRTPRMTEAGVFESGGDDLGDVSVRAGARPSRYSLTSVMNVSRSAVKASTLSSTCGGRICG